MFNTAFYTACLPQGRGQAFFTPKKYAGQTDMENKLDFKTVADAALNAVDNHRTPHRAAPPARRWRPGAFQRFLAWAGEGERQGKGEKGTPRKA